MGNTRTIASTTIEAIAAGGVTMRVTADGVLVEPPGGMPVVLAFTGDPDSPAARAHYQHRVAEHVAPTRRHTP